MLAKDFAYAFRSLLKSPVFALTAVVTIALGIGSATAIFSVANAVLLRNLPYRDPGRLVFDISDMRRRNVKDFPVSNAILIDFQNASKPLYENVGAVFTGRQVVPQPDGSPEQIRFATVTTNFFRTMGAAVLAGRDFKEQDGTPQPPPPAPGANAPAPPRLPIVAILSYEYFERRFGGDRTILGKPLPAFNQGNTEVVGVLPPHFELYFPTDANIERAPDVWFAARIPYDNANRMNVAYRMIGRLKAGVTLDQAQSSADQIAADMRRLYLIQNTSGFALRVEPLQQHVVEEVRPAILALTGAAIFLLLIACANVGNLLLVRASLRERELAVRTAMGAKFFQLVRQMLAEAFLIAGSGAALGLVLAWGGIHELRALAPANLPRLDAITIDGTVLLFAVAAALVAAIVFGLTPALRSARPDLAQVLRSSGRTASLGSAGLLRNAVVVAEVALSFVLLTGSGLMFRSFLELQKVDPGFDPRNLLTFRLLGTGGFTTPAAREAYVQAIHAALASVPGAKAVTASAPFPLAGGFSPIRWGHEDALADSTKFSSVDFQIVLPGYFETMGTKLLAGRTFTDADNTPGRNGVVIDRVLAAKAFPGKSAVGQVLYTRIQTPAPVAVEVIGVVEHQYDTSLADPGREQMYFTDGYLGSGAVGSWAIRTAGDPGQLAGPVRTAVAHIVPPVLVGEMQPMSALVSKAEAPTRFDLLLIGVFAVMAAILAGVGLYGVLATVVRQRTSEIGVRMALGAAPLRIFSLVVGQGMTLSVLGVGVGIVAAAALTRVLASMLIGVRPTDPTTFVSIAALFLCIAALASWLPARRAAGLDPTVALRDE